MTDTDLQMQADPAGDIARLDRIEARLTALEDKLAAFDAAVGMPPPPPGPAVPLLTRMNEFVRNNPVLALIGAIILLVVLSHLFD